MLMEGTPKVHLTPSNGEFAVWVAVPLEYMEPRLDGLHQMPVMINVRDGDEIVNKKLQFTANSTILSFQDRDEAEQIAAGLAQALSTEVDYTVVDLPNEEIHHT